MYQLGGEQSTSTTKYQNKSLDLHITYYQSKLLRNIATMSSNNLSIEGVKSSSIIEMIALGISKMDESEKKKQMKTVNGIFQMNVKSSEGKEGTWTIDFKKEGKVYLGPAKPKADVIINLSDETFQGLADGKINGQKAFMSSQLKVKGNIMLATKLDVLLKSAKSKL
ncbi:hypothetical protein Pst134EA_015192 [Puccinia striiformis f. sp. tritici]|uniref:SCP2 domain-containing protein n=1 Tax=Puccinia striiformis f. sp. tritici PST-78 TaxID=1165861 RepID=A0A0L0VAT4_9BASI|nr:hypothetical protein Pst134EA_015192 [Puccinia striiformis f. sp. tritici]KAH9463109.1 hypothetical protein Pst134EA_015192 [Puccinia striiformis f. sp. tritici]KAI9603088.1 hypothetical protein H4Q26_002400 [Puccinia striiformis f. sp. tritici PST-130]KNE96084.1 hypothetical protein PSTG_10656 [Puccinia striiformis f. sp. tritici PST-78]